MRELILNVRDLISRPGDSKSLKVVALQDEALEVGILRVSAGAELTLDLLLESVQEGILVSGGIVGEAEGQCSRCLKPITLPLEVDFEELFAYSGVSDDDLLVVNDQIDLNQVVIDSVVLSLPFQPVCSQDCLGLCAVCGARLEEHQDHSHEEAVDARWAPLSQLKLNPKDD
jgi:uncharacterized protein